MWKIRSREVCDCGHCLSRIRKGRELSWTIDRRKETLKFLEKIRRSGDIVIVILFSRRKEAREEKGTDTETNEKENEREKKRKWIQKETKRRSIVGSPPEFLESNDDFNAVGE